MVIDTVVVPFPEDPRLVDSCSGGKITPLARDDPPLLIARNDMPPPSNSVFHVSNDPANKIVHLRRHNRGYKQGLQVGTSRGYKYVQVGVTSSHNRGYK